MTSKIVRKLSVATGIALTNADYDDWLEGGANYDKFDAAVKAYLGPELYEAADATARMVGVLHAIVNGKRTATIGGMAFDFAPWYEGK